MKLNYFVIISILIIVQPLFFFETYKLDLEKYGGDFYCHKEAVKNIKDPEYGIQDKLDLPYNLNGTHQHFCKKNLKDYPRLFHNVISFFTKDDISNYSEVFTSFVVLFFILNRIAFFFVTDYLPKGKRLLWLFMLFVFPDVLRIFLVAYFNIGVLNFAWNFYSLESMVTHYGTFPSFISLTIFELSLVFPLLFFITIPVSFFISKSSRLIMLAFSIFHVFKRQPLLAALIFACSSFFFHGVISAALSLILIYNYRAVCTIFWTAVFFLHSLKNKKPPSERG